MKRLGTIKKATSIALLAAFSASVTACGTRDMNPAMDLQNQYGSFARKTDGKQAKWTIAVHMAADNNLYYAGLDDINEMEAGLKSDDVNVIVLFDGAKKGDSAIYKIKADKNGYDRTIISEIIDDKGAVVPSSKEIDSGDPQVFNKFVDWVTKNYPADRNFISIWNHGSGIYRADRPLTDKNYPLNGSSFIPKPVKDIKLSKDAAFHSKAFASDDQGGEMHLKDLNPALAIANRNLGKKLDVLGFDTCLMGHLETAYQVKDQANYLVASEELEPGDGWDYHAWISELSKNPSMNPAQMTTSLVDTYGKSYAPGGSQSGRDVTLSSLDINALVSDLVPALNELSADLKSSLPSQQTALSGIRTKTESYYNRDAADLGHFLSNLQKDAGVESELKSKAAKVSAAYGKTVVRETHTGKTNGVSNASGMVIYFPTSTMSYNKRYDNAADIKFAEQPAWGNFLKAFSKS